MAEDTNPPPGVGADPAPDDQSVPEEPQASPPPFQPDLDLITYLERSQGGQAGDTRANAPEPEGT